MLGFAPLLALLIETYTWRKALQIIAGGSLLICFSLGLLMASPADSGRETPETGAVRDSAEPHTGSPQDVAIAIKQDEFDKTYQDRLLEVCRQADAWFWTLSLVLQNLGWAFTLINYVRIYLFVPCLNADLHDSYEL